MKSLFASSTEQVENLQTKINEQVENLQTKMNEQSSAIKGIKDSLLKTMHQSDSQGQELQEMQYGDK